MKVAPLGAVTGALRDGEADTQVVPEGSVSVADTAAVAVRASRYVHISLAVGVLAFIALVAALYFARAFFVPLLIGILAS
jgi:hypothetical protein